MGLRNSHTRSITAGMLAGAMAVSAIGVATAQDGPDLSGQSLVISNWDGYMPEDLPERFEEATGVPVTVANHATNEEIVTTLTASDDPGIDVAFVSGQFAQALGEFGVLEPLDHAQIPNLANLYPEATELAYDPGNTVSAPYAWGTTGLCYRSDLIDTPTSWYDLLEPAEDVTGKTTMLATERWLMLPAQKALGFSVNTTDEGEMQQVKELLSDTKDTLLAYDDTTFYARLVSGEAVLVEAWDGWCNYGISDPEVGGDIDFVVPEEGSDLWTDTMVILGSSENKEAAHAFIDFILEPEVHTWVVENILYKVPNQAAMEAIDPGLIEAFPNLGMTSEELFAGEQLVDLGDAAPMYTQIATEIAAQ
jgi:spermidine/putrescine transport system substrate-binding protein